MRSTPPCGREVLCQLRRACFAYGDCQDGVDLLGSDRKLQDHWLRRFIALVIDSVVVTVAGTVLTALLFFPALLGSVAIGILPAAVFNPFTTDLWGFPFALGFLYILYFAILEFSYGHTLGKRVMNLKVATVEGGRPELAKTFMRNVSKIFWVLLLVDVLAGLGTTGNPRQKISDRYARTVVLDASPHAGQRLLV